jgi:hypothetical protein
MLLNFGDLMWNSVYNMTFVSGLELYNEIPGDIKREVSRNVFKIKITKFIKESVPSLPSGT